MEMVYQVEAAMRQVFRPAKINLASLGNVVPHLHWHVIARFENDADFCPAPIWAAPVREQRYDPARKLAGTNQKLNRLNLSGLQGPTRLVQAV